MKKTYKDFAEYLRAIAEAFSQYGESSLDEGKEYEKLYTTLCQIHNDFDHGAERIEALKRIFISQCEDYGQGWIPSTQVSGEPSRKEFTEEQLCIIKEQLSAALYKDLEAECPDNAEEDLEIINIIQGLTGEEPYKDISHFKELTPNLWKDNTISKGKEFTSDQLTLIRDLMGDMLDKDIELGHTENAEEDLEIINVIQSRTNCDEYESLDQYKRNISGSWTYVELPKKEDEED